VVARTHPPEPTWTDRERAAWHVPPPMRPSEWAEAHRVLFRSSIPGPYRHDNAPYMRGLMDIITRPGVVQANLQASTQIAKSETQRNLIGYWAHYDPKPVGLTLPSRDKGRKIVKSDILPMFRRTPVLADLLGRPGRDALIESIDLLNGFHLGLMWAGSSTATASDPYAVVLNDEVDKMDEDAIGATESRLTTYGDRRLQFNTSSPTVATGRIAKLLASSTVKLHYYVPCPHCGHYQRLVWTQIRWAKPRRLRADKVRLADAIGHHRDRAVQYQCESCSRFIRESHKAAMLRQGRWSTAAGYVLDYKGRRHVDAATVDRWPNETRIGLQISGLYSLFVRWAKIVAEFLLAEGDFERAFIWKTERMGEPFEFRISRSEANIFSDKCRRAAACTPPLLAGLVPAWAWSLLATIDTQADHFYCVVRAWGAGLKSQRIWHGQLSTFDQLDRLILSETWPVDGEQFPPMAISLALIDSGGTADQFLDATRTHQVYDWVIPRQALVRAIKGSSRNGPGLYWPMKNPLGGLGRKDGTDLSALRGWMIDTHRCNDLLGELIVRGIPTPAAAGGSEPATGPETWLLNASDDPEYNAHMAALHKTPDKSGRSYVEVWKPIHAGSRHDYRDCEAYQIAAAYMANIHLLPEQDEVLRWKRLELEQAQAALTARRREPDPDAWKARPL
jgi:phage terminase large subunit GpA-like protein